MLDAPRLSVTQEQTSGEHEFKVKEEIHSAALPNRSFYLMNLFATVVASYGLLANSPAVVIGAMVIAVLLGPIAGTGLALVTGERSELLRALLAIATGAFEVFAVSYVIGSIHGMTSVPQEILSRTEPTLYDLMIALAGGAAGAYAVGRRVPGGTMMGVAIATALVPPLSVVGITASQGNWSMASGAFLLFLSNLVAIQLAYSVVLYLLGFRRDGDPTHAWKRTLGSVVPSLVLFIGLATFLGYTLENRLERHRIGSTLRETLLRGLSAIPGAYLDEVTFTRTPERVNIVASVNAPVALTPEQVGALEESAARVLRREVHLSIRSILMKIATSSGYLYEQKAVEAVMNAPAAATESADTVQENMSDSLRRQDSARHADSLRIVQLREDSVQREDSIMRSRRNRVRTGGR